MCGIVGYIGNQDAKEVLLQGLEKLEYRGYDSAGIFVMDSSGEGNLFKEKGRIKELRQEVKNDAEGTVGIGHTRWATHGVPSALNAHPHQSENGRFSLVHNGVIENYRELKEAYLQGVTFHSETDTEVIVHLIAKFAEEGLETFDAFKKVVQLLKGSYALGLADREQPEKVFAAKNKSPLLVGVGRDFNVLCSDAMAMIRYTDQFMELMDEELVVLTDTAVHIEDVDGNVKERVPYTAELDANDIEKGTYPYYMLKEIDEQPGVIRQLVQNYQGEHGELEIDEEIIQAMLASDRIYVIAAGTSNHAGWIGKQLLEKIAGIPVEVHVASEFSYNMPLLTEKPFFIYISQSGETADSRAVLVKTNEMNYPSLAVTNVAGSTLSRESDYTLLLHAGPEIAVASTKAYTAQIGVLAILADVLGRAKGKTPEFDMIHDLGIVANAMDVVINEKETMEEIARLYLSKTRSAFYIGRAMDYYVSMEAALKLKEISYIQTEGFAAGELKHGTIALIEEGVPVVALITDAGTAGHTRGNIEEVRSRGAATVVVSMEGLNREGDQIVLPEINPLLSALVSVIPTQLLAYYATLHRGYDVDKPRNLAKSVTVE